MRKLPAVRCLSPVLLVLLLPAYVIAHGTGFRLVEAHGARAVGCYYSSGDPMAYAKVLVYGPDEMDVEYQNGRLDRLGRFAFLPDRPGTWRVIASDGQGHRVVARVRVDSPGKQEDPFTGGRSGNREGDLRSGIPGALFGASIIFNLAFVLYGFREKFGRSS